MLLLTRLSGPKFALNPDLIERAEATPDTVVTLVNGSKYVIRESLEELLGIFRDYRSGLISASRTAAPEQHPTEVAGSALQRRESRRAARAHAGGGSSPEGATVVPMMHVEES